MIKIAAGIYQIKNVINNKCYVGSAVNFRRRWYKHKHELNTKCHHSQALQRAWDKYGENNFQFIIIEEVHDKAELINREQYYLDTLNPEYVICKTAGSTLGKTHSEEAKQRMRKPRSEETKQKMRKPKSEEHRLNMSKAFKEKFKNKENHPWFGRHHKKEQYI
jgi:group I intron endonuclease